jgi:hypothetical protein
MFNVGTSVCVSFTNTKRERRGGQPHNNKTTTTTTCFLNNSCNHQSHPNGMVLMTYINGMDKQTMGVHPKKNPKQANPFLLQDQ